MVRYKRTPSKDAKGNPIFRYFKDGNPVKEVTIPHEVLDKFEIVPETDYNDEPERRRCFFCDAPQKRIRSLNMKMVDLCEWHYQHLTLGEIAGRIRKAELHELWSKPKEVKKKKRAKKTKLSALVS